MEKFDDRKLREKLTPIQYKVTQENATEMPFTGEYLDNDKKGIYVDLINGEPLFSSMDKFDSGCGWPSFAKPVYSDIVNELTDISLGRSRTEVRSSTSDAHLGHVFEDGPEELGGLRYCINSAALKFIAYEDMEKLGYGKYMNIFPIDKE